MGKPRVTGATKLARDSEITRKAGHGWTNAEIGKHFDLHPDTVSRIIQKEIRQRHTAHAGSAEAIAASLKLERFANSLTPESDTSALPATGGQHADAYQNTLTLNLELPWGEAEILLRHARTLVGILERQLDKRASNANSTNELRLKNYVKRTGKPSKRKPKTANGQI